MICGPAVKPNEQREIPPVGTHVLSTVPVGERGSVRGVVLAASPRPGADLVVWVHDLGRPIPFLRHEVRPLSEQPRPAPPRVDVCGCPPDHPAHRSSFIERVSA